MLINESELIAKALEARAKAYAPYSGYAVGAALMTATGKIYCGCNIENAAYSATVCAERTAIFKAVSEGEHDILAIAIVGSKREIQAPLPDFASPCGVCRQVLSEFASPDAKIILGKSIVDWQSHTLGELLPLSFSSKNL